MPDEPVVITHREQSRRDTYIGLLGVLVGVAFGIIVTGMVSHNVLEKERHHHKELRSCDPAVGEAVLARRDAAGILTCERRPLSDRLMVAPKPLAWLKRRM